MVNNSDCKISQIKQKAIKAVASLTDEQCRSIIKALKERKDNGNEDKHHGRSSD